VIRPRHATIALVVFLAGCAVSPTGDSTPLQKPDVAARDADRLYRLIPAPATSVLYFNYRAIRKLGGGSLLGDDKATNDGIDAQGFDERTDVDHSVQAAFPNDGEAEKPNLLLYVGRFAAEKLAASRIGKSGEQTYRDRDVWGGPLLPRYLSLVSRNLTLVGLGPRSVLQTAIDCDDARSDPVATVPWFQIAGRHLAQTWPEEEPLLVELRAIMTAEAKTQLPEPYADLGRLESIAIRIGGNDGISLQALGRTGSIDEARGVAAWARETLAALAETPTMVRLGFANFIVRTEVTVEPSGKGAVVRWQLTLAPKERSFVVARIQALFEAARVHREKAEPPPS
jgi:hypothetical protein